MSRAVLEVLFWLMSIAFIGLLLLLALAPFWPRLSRWFADGEDVDV